MKNRNPWTAFLLSVASPGIGIGQIYNQEGKKALIIALCTLVLFPVSLLFLYTEWKAFIIFWLLALIFIVWVIVDAFIGAKRKNNVELVWFNRWWIYVGLTVFGLTGDYFIKGYINKRVYAFKLASNSMVPNLELGDHIIASMRENLSSNVERGDIVVFERLDDSGGQSRNVTVVKRIVGMPNETIEVRGDQVLIDRKLLDEPYARYQRGGLGDFPASKIPPGTYFRRILDTFPLLLLQQRLLSENLNTYFGIIVPDLGELAYPIFYPTSFKIF